MANEPDLVISAGFSDAQLVKEANKVVAFYKKRGEEAQKAFLDAQGKVTNTQAARAHANELDKLSKSYDPVYRAAKRYEDEVKRLDRALNVGAISQKQYVAEVGRAAREWKSAGETIHEAGRKAGTGWQNIGWQVGDFATQVGAGTSAAQALGQQLPQLLGGFGTFGALAGAAAAIMVPLGAALLKAGDESKNYDANLKAVTDSTDAMREAIERASMPLSELTAKYGSAAGEAQKFYQQQSLISQAIAANDLATLGKSIGGIGGGFGDKSEQAGWFVSFLAGQSGVENVRTLTGTQKKVQELMDTFRIGRPDAEKLAAAMQKVYDAGGDASKAQVSAEALVATMTEIAGGADKVGERFGGKDGLWGKVSDYFDTASAQAEALRSEQTKIITQYQTDTEKLSKLNNDRKSGQEALDKAVKDGSAAAIKLATERLGLIDAEIAKTRELITVNDEAFKAMQKRIQAGAGGFIDGVVENATGTSLSQWGKDIAASQKGILDLIKSRESGGDYNATLDNGRWTGGARDLINMTLKEVLALQSTMRTPENRALYGNGQGSSALGAYQIVGKTLEGLIKELNLTGDELFSREMQDRMAMQLLRRRQGQGVQGLRNEWEGLNGVSPAVIQNAMGQQSIERVDPEIQKNLDKEIKDRERLAEQAKKYGEQLAQNLLTEQQSAKLAADQAAKVSDIKAQGLSPEAEARAIAAVTAETEKQRVVMTLIADAKRRNVELDAKLADGSMTYREAILALGEAKRQDIVATNERAIAEGKAAEAQQLMADAQAQVKMGLIDSIVAGESFASVLQNVAQMFAKAALQAALFNEGPWAKEGGGSGLLGGIVKAIFGGFASGGYTGTGGRYEPAGIVHKGEYVMSAPAVKRIGIANLEAMHNGAPIGGGSSAAHITVGIDPKNGNITAFVEERAGGIAARTVAANNKQLPNMVQKTIKKPRTRW